MSLKGYFSDDPDVQSMTDEEQEAFFSALSQPSNLQSYFADDPDVQAMNPSEKEAFFSSLLAPDPVPSASEVVGALATGIPMQTVGLAGQSAGGLMQSAGELTGIESLADAGKTVTQLGKNVLGDATPARQTVEAALGPTGRFIAMDLPAEGVAQVGPLVASAYTGSWVPVVMSTFVRAYGLQYGRMREHDYGVAGSTVRAAGSAGFEAVGEWFALGHILNFGKPIARRLIRVALTEAGSEMVTEGLDLLADWITDRLFATDNEGQPLLDPNMTAMDAIKQVLQAGAGGAILGPVLGGVGDIALRQGLAQEGKTIVRSPKGYGVVVPVELKDATLTLLAENNEAINSEEEAAALVQAVHDDLSADIQSSLAQEADAREIHSRPLESFMPVQGPAAPGVTVGSTEGEQFMEAMDRTNQGLDKMVGNIEAEKEAQRILEEGERVTAEVRAAREAVPPPAPPPDTSQQTFNGMTPGQVLAQVPPAPVTPAPVEPTGAEERVSRLGEVVAIHPDVITPERGQAIRQISGIKMTTPLDGTIVRENTDGTVDVQVENGIVKDLPQTALLQPSQVAEFQRTEASAETPQLVGFLRKMLVPEGLEGLDQMGPEKLQLLTGKFLKVLKQVGKRGRAYGSYTRGKPGANSYINTVHDLLAANPALLIRVLGHEIGHFLDLASDKDLEGMGMGALAPFRQVLYRAVEREMGRPVSETLTAEQEARWNEWNRAKTRTYDERVNYFTTLKYGHELAQIWRSWALFPGNKASFNELMANALSAFINRPAIQVGVKMNPDSLNLEPTSDYNSLKLFQVFQGFVNANPAMKKALDDIYASGNKAYTLADFEANRRRANAVEQKSRVLKASKGLSTKDWLQAELYSTVAPMLNRLSAANWTPQQIAQVEDKIDGSNFNLIQVEAYYKHVLENILGERLTKAGLRYEEFEMYSLLRAIIGSRMNMQEFVAVPKGMASKQFRAWLKQIKTRAMQEAKLAIPDTGSKEYRDLVHTLVRDFLNDSKALIQRRYGLQNPDGVSAQDAFRLLNEMAVSLGPKFSALKPLFEDWQLARSKMILNPVINSRVLPDELARKMESNPDYVTFNVVYHLFENSRKAEDRQVGTLADVADVVASTLEKDARLFQWTQHEAARRDVIKMIQSVSPEMVIEAKRYRGEFDETAPSTGWVLLKTRENLTGKVTEKGYWVAPEIGVAFERDPSKPLQATLGVATKWLTGWMTAFQPIFGLFNFTFMDLPRSIRDLPGLGSFTVPFRAISYLNQARKMAFYGELSPTMKELVDNAIPLSNLQFSSLTKDELQIDQLANMVSRSESLRQKSWNELLSIRYAVGRLNGFMKHYFGGFNQTLEIASKAGAWDYAKTLPISPAEQRTLVRNVAGTPNGMRHGRATPTLGLFYIFLNPAMQAMGEDLKVAKQRPLEFVAKTLTTQMPLRLFMLLGLAGALGPEWKEYYRRISVGRLIDNPIIPLGETASGESVYYPVPVDPLSGIIGALAFAPALALVDPELPIKTGLKNIGEMATGLVPQTNPIFGLLSDFVEWQRTGNVYDRFRGMDVLDPDVASTGKGAWWALAKYELFNKGLGGPLSALWKFPYRSDSPQFKKDPKGIVQHIVADIEKITYIPLASSLFSRLLRVDSRGIKERQDLALASVDQKAAERRMLAKEITRDVRSQLVEGEESAAVIVRKVMEGYMISPEDADLISSDPRPFARALTEMMKQVSMGEKYAALNPYWSAILKANSKQKTLYAVDQFLKAKQRLDDLENKQRSR